MLNDLDIRDKDLRVIQNLYFNQSATVRYNDCLSKSFVVSKGVRPGCVMSPDLFSLYSEIILRSIDGVKGLKIGGVNLNNLRFADDTVLIAENRKDLQNLLRVVNEKGEAFGMKINVKKTEVLVFSRDDVPPVYEISLNGNVLKQVDTFKYLGTLLSHDGRSLKKLSR